MFKSITHVIYDMDGLLLDTESLNEQVNSEIVQRYGKSFNAELKIAIAGRTTIDSARIIIDTLEIPLTVEEYIVEKDREMPEGFCSSAWKSIDNSLSLIQWGGDYYPNLPKGVAITCCSDGIRPVSFKIERLEN